MAATDLVGLVYDGLASMLAAIPCINDSRRTEAWCNLQEHVTKLRRIDKSMT